MTSHLLNYYIGIDVSKAVLDVFILPTKQYFQVTNDDNGIGQLLTQLQALPQARIVMEATGGYEKPLCLALQLHHQHVAVVNPRQIRHFGKALGQLAKTDKIDAKLIALYAEKLQSTSLTILDEHHQQLLAYQTRHQQLMQLLIIEKNHVEHANPVIRKRIQQVIHTLQQEIDWVQNALADLLQANPHFQQKVALLKTVKGIGPKVSTAILAHLPELGTLSTKQAAALAGLAPFNCDSGKQRGKRMTWGGRAPLRNALYMATLVAIRHNPQIRAFYQRLCAIGKMKMVAIVACMRKLLSIINAMIKHNQPWHYVTPES